MGHERIECDILIVGGGTAGSVLASRLSEDPSTSVVLLEAGRDIDPNDPPRDVRDLFPLSTFNPAYAWRELKVHWRLPSNSPAVPFQQARVLGGGSTVMGMWAVRGVPEDYDGWAAMGATGWGWGDVLPFFRRLEHDFDYAGPSHGSQGPIPIRRQPVEQWSALAQAASVAAQAAGYGHVADMNAEFDDGHCSLPISRHETSRASAGLCYLTCDVRKRRSLRIFSETEAERLTLEGGGVVGCLARRGSGGTLLEFRAKETILTAGAIFTPWLLMRSGIGPAQLLQRSGLPVFLDRNGVGRNLQNHPLLPSIAFLRSGARDAGRGRPPASSFLRFSSQLTGSTRGDVGLYIRSYLLWHALGRHMAMIGPVLLRPFSRGYVGVAPGEHTAILEVAFNNFEDPRDLERMILGLQLTWRLLSHPSLTAITEDAFFILRAARLGRLTELSRVNAALGWAAALMRDHAPYLGNALLARLADMRPLRNVLEDEEGLATFVAENATGTNHVAGTCRMGRSDDNLAVVDPQGRLFGMAGLRVADASIMPIVPSGNTHIPTVMVAEKIAAAMMGGGHG